MLQKRIRFPNTIKRIFVFQEGINDGCWFRLENTVLTEATIGTPESVDRQDGRRLS